MLQRIETIKDAVITTLSLLRPDLAMTLQEWEVIKEVIPILKPFHEVANEISTEKNVTISKVTVLCNLLEGYISKCVPSNEQIASMVAKIKNDLKVRFGDLESNALYAESSILDPRFKRKGFKNDMKYESDVQTLRSRICSIRLPNSNSTNDTLQHQ